MADKRISVEVPGAAIPTHAAFGAGDQLLTPDGEKTTGGVQSDRMVFVDYTLGDDVISQGKAELPFKTPQAAYDFAATKTPTTDNPMIVALRPGAYPTTLIMDSDNIHLVGVGGQQVTNLGASAAPSLIVTNATRASVAAFLAAGGGTDPAAHYGLLVAGPNTPRNVQVREVSLNPTSGGVARRLIVAGVGAGNSVGGSEINFMACCNWGRSYLRLANYVSFQGGSWCANLIEAHNVAGVWCNDAQITGYTGYYNGAEDEPSDNGNYGLCGGKTLCVGNVVLNSDAGAGAGDPMGGLVLFQITGNVDLNGTGHMVCASSGIGGNVDAEAGASFDLKGCHVQGGITLAAGAGTAQMDGGHYMGALVDPGAKFVRNVGA